MSVFKLLLSAVMLIMFVPNVHAAEGEPKPGYNYYVSYKNVKGMAADIISRRLAGYEEAKDLYDRFKSQEADSEGYVIEKFTFEAVKKEE